MKIREMALIKEELLDELQYKAEGSKCLSYPIKMEVEIDRPEFIAIKNVDGHLILSADHNFMTDDDYTYSQIKWEHDDLHTETLNKAKDLTEGERQLSVINIKLENIGEADDADNPDSDTKCEHDNLHTEILIKAEDIAEGDQQFSVVNIKLENIGETERNAGDDMQEAKAKNNESTKFKCSLCPYIAKRRRDIKQHMVVRHQDRMFKCEKCSYVTRRKFYLKKHVQLEHRDQFEFFKCRGCPFITTCMKSIGHHVAMKHKDPQKSNQLDDKSKVEIKNSSQIDDKSTVAIESSTEWHIVRQKDANEETKLKCSNCSYVSESMTHMMDHLFNKHKKSHWYQCDKCLFSVNREQSLKDHIIYEHTLISKDKSAFARADLNKVIKNKPIYSCDLCPYKTKKKSDLKQHELLHKDPAERPMFECDMCLYKSKLKVSLRHHVEYVHHGYVYECGECFYTCIYKRTLKRHVMRKHNMQL